MDTYLTLPIHQCEELIDQCITLLNSEWPRSYTARLWSLKASRDSLPTSMILVTRTDKYKSRVIAHAKLSPIPADTEAVFLESVVVDQKHRGKGLGRLLMNEVENHSFGVLGSKRIFLSTIDQDGFYLKLGYKFCKAINMFGTRNCINNSTKKIWMMKSLADWK